MLVHIAKISLMTAALSIAGAADADPAKDAWITAKVGLTMLGAGGVDSSTIEVDTLDGIVILQGEVALAADRTRASAIALDVEDVQGVRNLIAVVPVPERESARATDEHIGREVHQAIASDPDLAGSAIEVESVHGGIVFLAGHADSLAAHERALADAGEVDGVDRVASGIRSPDALGDRHMWEEGGVELPGEQSTLARFANDLWITVRAKVRLMREPGLSPFAVEVNTEAGVVTLSGMVKTKTEVEQAESELMRIDGVVRVANYLQIAPTRAASI